MRNIYSFPRRFAKYSPKLFQPLGELLSYYNEKWFSIHHFGFGNSGKLKFGLNTHMTYNFVPYGFWLHRVSLYGARTLEESKIGQHTL